MYKIKKLKINKKIDKLNLIYKKKINKWSKTKKHIIENKIKAKSEKLIKN